RAGRVGRAGGRERLGEDEHPALSARARAVYRPRLHRRARRRPRARGRAGGMQQRLALAVALLGDPPILLLDEPSASLDEEGQHTLAAVVARLRAGGRTLLLASHRREEVAALTDRVLRIDGGRLGRPAPASARVVALEERRGGRP